MHILVVGTNHRACPIELRERLAFRQEQLQAAYAALRHELGLREALILSTCNRVEIYAGVERLNGTFERLDSFLGAHSQLPSDRLIGALYRHREPTSVQHLFSVASGLDSMVLGETEILHQVKSAYDLARQHGTTGKVLNVLFQKALNAGKAVRTRTGISQGAVSVGSVAIELAQKIFSDLTGDTVLLIGAGTIGELTLKHLADRGVRDIRIANRSIERAVLLASAYGGTAHGLDALSQQIVEADIVITSTSAAEPLLDRATLDGLMAQRKRRPLCLIDLGVPRNIDPAAADLENLYLFDVDDLQALVGHYHARRQQAVEASEAIIQRKADHFLAWWQKEMACAPSSLEAAGAR